MQGSQRKQVQLIVVLIPATVIKTIQAVRRTKEEKRHLEEVQILTTKGSLKANNAYSSNNATVVGSCVITAVWTLATLKIAYNNGYLQIPHKAAAKWQIMISSYWRNDLIKPAFLLLSWVG